MRQGKKAKQSDIRNFFPGRVTDRVVRNWLQDDPANNLGKMPSMVEEIVARELEDAKDGGEVVGWKHNTDRAEVIASCKTAVTEIQPALERYVLPYTWQVDFGFKTPLLLENPWGVMDRVILNGYMDILVYDPETDTWRIYDVKHTADANYWRGSFGQLVFYSFENLIRTGKVPLEVGFFQPLVKEQVKRFAMDEQHINALSARIHAMADEVWRKYEPPTGDPRSCMFCEVKHACIKYKPVEVSDGSSRVSLLGS